MQNGEAIPIEDGEDDLANTVNMLKLNDSPAPKREQQSKSSPSMPPTASTYTGIPAQFASQPPMGGGYASSQPPPPPYASSQPPPPPPPPPPPSGPPTFYSSKF